MERLCRVVVVGGVNAKVTESDVEVSISVEVGERKNMIMIKWWCGGLNCDSFLNFDLHFVQLELKLMVVMRGFISRNEKKARK